MLLVLLFEAVVFFYQDLILPSLILATALRRISLGVQRRRGGLPVLGAVAVQAFLGGEIKNLLFD